MLTHFSFYIEELCGGEGKWNCTKVGLFSILSLLNSLNIFNNKIMFINPKVWFAKQSKCGNNSGSINWYFENYFFVQIVVYSEGNSAVKQPSRLVLPNIQHQLKL